VPISLACLCRTYIYIIYVTTEYACACISVWKKKNTTTRCESPPWYIRIHYNICTCWWLNCLGWLPKTTISRLVLRDSPRLQPPRKSVRPLTRVSSGGVVLDSEFTCPSVRGSRKILYPRVEYYRRNYYLVVSHSDCTSSPSP